MNLKAKTYLENQKKDVDVNLAARRAALKEKGLAAGDVQRDSLIRKLKAEIRQADYRLACVAAQEKLTADKAEAKQKKLAAPTEAAEKPAKAAKAAAGKKVKKEKQKAPAPAEKEQE